MVSIGKIDYIVKRKNIKSLRLKVTSDSVVEVSAPYYVRDKEIQKFVQDNSDFVMQKLSAIQYARAVSYPADYSNGDMFTLLGRRVMLSIHKAEKNSAKFSGNVLDMKVTDTKDRQLCQKAFEAWARRYAKKVFEERLRFILPKFTKLAKKDIRISVRDMKTRWGSINVKRDTMSLSVHLIRCDIKLVDHIIIHELCHYAHTNHSRAFYAELQKYSPNYKQLQKQLKEYGMVGF